MSGNSTLEFGLAVVAWLAEVLRQNRRDKKKSHRRRRKRRRRSRS